MKNRIKFGKNEEAVSPVIGVILMVAITVILAAVIAAFVFGMGPPVKAPQAQLKFAATAGATGYLKLSHDGGDPLVLKDEKITVKFANNETVIGSTGGTGGIYQLTLYDASPSLTTGFTTIQTLTAGSVIQTIWGTGGLGITTNIPGKGDILTVQILDTPSGQLIASAKVTVT